ncbi:hypothetical protein [Halopseudomonas salegens]|uniref:hypothetical protein n=1 Tax=Halopseudomonas salegens TaxID=1434072 RepID=UPI0012FD0841|nr:hypothetical protein [Halopseudomonas salegens]
MAKLTLTGPLSYLPKEQWAALLVQDFWFVRKGFQKYATKKNPGYIGIIQHIASSNYFHNSFSWL